MYVVVSAVQLCCHKSIFYCKQNKHGLMLMRQCPGYINSGAMEKAMITVVAELQWLLL